MSRSRISLNDLGKMPSIVLSPFSNSSGVLRDFHFYCILLPAATITTSAVATAARPRSRRPHSRHRSVIRFTDVSGRHGRV